MSFAESKSQNTSSHVFVRFVSEADVIPSIHLRHLFYQVMIILFLGFLVSLRTPEAKLTDRIKRPVISHQCRIKTSILCINNNENSENFNSPFDLKLTLFFTEKQNFTIINAAVKIIVEIQRTDVTPFVYEEIETQKPEPKRKQNNPFYDEDFLKDLSQTKTYYRELTKSFYTNPFTNRTQQLILLQINTREDDIFDGESFYDANLDIFLSFSENSTIFEKNETVAAVLDVIYDNPKYSKFLDIFGFFFSVLLMICLFLLSYKLLTLSSLKQIRNEHKIFILYLFLSIIRNLLISYDSKISKLLNVTTRSLSIYSISVFLASTAKNNQTVYYFNLYFILVLIYPFLIFLFYPSKFHTIHWEYVYDYFYFMLAIFFLFLSKQIKMAQNKSNQKIDVVDSGEEESTQSNQSSEDDETKKGIRKFTIIDFIGKMYIFLTLILHFCDNCFSFNFLPVFMFIVANILPLLLTSVSYPQIRSFDDQSGKNIQKPHLDIPFLSKLF